jgi:hypothetical protein
MEKFDKPIGRGEFLRARMAYLASMHEAGDSFEEMRRAINLGEGDDGQIVLLLQHWAEGPGVRVRNVSDQMPKKIPPSMPNEIQGFVHCGKCLSEVPEHLTPGEYQHVNVGFTKQGLQVWCVRHNCNVMHIDFEGQKHPANTGT